ncbi:MAG: hypothetical protein AAF581_06730, partial [Planctomycetota bacterium]
ALHQETESIGTVIRDVEERLRSMNLGIEAWLSEQPIWSREMSVSSSPVAPRLELQLGFAPLRGSRSPAADSWHLQLREAEVTPTAGVIPGEGTQRLRIQDQQPLARCSREDQVAALRLLPDILAHLVELAQQRIEAIRAAKKLV